MSFKEHLRKVMLTYPRSFPAPICVYDHLFLTIGNGYVWQDGELVYDDENSLCDTVEEAIDNIKNYYFELVKEIHAIHTKKDGTFDNIVNSYIKETTRYIHNILNIDDMLEDMSIPNIYDPALKEGEENKFKFYGLSKYSAIANIPDDVHYDWIKAIKDFVDILDKNKDKFKDSENLFDSVKKRVNTLFKKRITEFVDALP